MSFFRLGFFFYYFFQTKFAFFGQNHSESLKNIHILPKNFTKPGGKKFYFLIYIFLIYRHDSFKNTEHHPEQNHSHLHGSQVRLDHALSEIKKIINQSHAD